jgi:hypothetical protein
LLFPPTTAAHEATAAAISPSKRVKCSPFFTLSCPERQLV